MLCTIKGTVWWLVFLCLVFFSFSPPLIECRLTVIHSSSLPHLEHLKPSKVLEKPRFTEYFKNSSKKTVCFAENIKGKRLCVYLGNL